MLFMVRRGRVVSGFFQVLSDSCLLKSDIEGFYMGFFINSPRFTEKVFNQLVEHDAKFHAVIREIRNTNFIMNPLSPVISHGIVSLRFMGDRMNVIMKHLFLPLKRGFYLFRSPRLPAGPKKLFPRQTVELFHRSIASGNRKF